MPPGNAREGVNMCSRHPLRLALAFLILVTIPALGQVPTKLDTVLAVSCVFVPLLLWAALLLWVWVTRIWTKERPPSHRKSEPIYGDEAFQAACWQATTRRDRDPESPPIVVPSSPCETLGVPTDASRDEIRRAYRKLILLHHPDRGGDPEKAKEIIDAYRSLREQNDTSR